MSNMIEQVEKTQQRTWKRCLIALVLLEVLLIFRYSLYLMSNEQNYNRHPIAVIVLILSVILLIVLIALVLKLGRLKSQIMKDPQLKAALIDNELIKKQFAESWQIGFIGAVATPFAFLVVNSFAPVNDLLLVALTTAAAGSVSFLLAFYVKSQSDG